MLEADSETTTQSLTTENAKQPSSNKKTATLDSQPLKILGDKFAEKTLFAMISELKLSKAIEHFNTDKFEPFLKNNLSAVVMNKIAKNGKIDASKLPFKDLYKDSSEVVFYKQLINSIYHLQVGLKQLEAINNLGDANNLVTRTRFIAHTYTALIKNIQNGQYYLKQAASNDALNSLLQSSLDILEPLKNIPVIGDYLKNSLQIAPQATTQIDIFAAWNAQLAIVQSGLTGVHEKASISAQPTIEPAQTAEIPANEINYLELIAKQLYQIPAALKKFNSDSAPTDEQIESQVRNFIDGLQGLSIGPGSANKILKSISLVQTQISSIGEESRKLAFNQLKNIRAQLGAELIEAADLAEFNLGLKSGTLSTTVEKSFNEFYKAMLYSLVDDEQLLDLIFDVTVSQKRLMQEKTRLKEVWLDTKAETQRRILFGDDYAKDELIYNAFKELQNTAKELDVFTPDLEVQQEEIAFQELEINYSQLQPYLQKIDPKFDEHYCDGKTSRQEIQEVLDEIFSSQHLINNPTGWFSQLKDFSLQVNFKKDISKEQFLNYYKELQPFLVQIDSSYNLNYFLRQLQTPKDFKDALAKIIELEPKLEQLIQGMEDSNQIRASLCQERIEYISTKLHKDLMDEIFVKWETNIQRNLGPFAGVFLKEISSEMKALKTTLATLSVDELQSIGIEKFNAIKSKFSSQEQAWTDLNKLVAKITASLTNENKLPTNPVRVEKIVLLRALKSELTNLDNLEHNSVETIESLKNSATESLMSITNFDRIIEISELLILLKENANLKKNDALKYAQLSQLEKMENILFNPKEDLNLRLTEIVALASSPECKKILLKSDSNDTFKKALDKILDTESKDLGIFKRFKEKLQGAKASKEESTLSVKIHL